MALNANHANVFRLTMQESVVDSVVDNNFRIHLEQYQNNFPICAALSIGTAGKADGFVGDINPILGKLFRTHSFNVPAIFMFLSCTIAKVDLEQTHGLSLPTAGLPSAARRPGSVKSAVFMDEKGTT